MANEITNEDLDALVTDILETQGAVGRSWVAMTAAQLSAHIRAASSARIRASIRRLVEAGTVEAQDKASRRPTSYRTIRSLRSERARIAYLRRARAYNRPAPS